MVVIVEIMAATTITDRLVEIMVTVVEVVIVRQEVEVPTTEAHMVAHMVVVLTAEVHVAVDHIAVDHIAEALSVEVHAVVDHIAAHMAVVPTAEVHAVDHIAEALSVEVHAVVVRMVVVRTAPLVAVVDRMVEDHTVEAITEAVAKQLLQFENSNLCIKHFLDLAH